MWSIAIVALVFFLAAGLVGLIAGIGKGSELYYGIAKVAGLLYLWICGMVVSYVFVCFMRWLAGLMN